MTTQSQHDSLRPVWWTKEVHESAWERAKAALERDWEQTKRDLGGRGPDLNQDVGDTIKQAAGKDILPAPGQPNIEGGTENPNWDRDREPARFGVGARQQYGAQHPTWTEDLEQKLSGEWEAGTFMVKRAWSDVRHAVRRGYEKVI
jgi:hypothetical protein